MASDKVAVFDTFRSGLRNIDLSLLAHGCAFVLDENNLGLQTADFIDCAGNYFPLKIRIPFDIHRPGGWTLAEFLLQHRG